MTMLAFWHIQPPTTRPMCAEITGPFVRPELASIQALVFVDDADHMAELGIPLTWNLRKLQRKQNQTLLIFSFHVGFYMILLFMDDQQWNANSSSFETELCHWACTQFEVRPVKEDCPFWQNHHLQDGHDCGTAVVTFLCLFL